MRKYWVAIASAEHVRLGRMHGFMQVCHGKSGPLKRIHPGDLVVYYSPTLEFGGKNKLQAFTAIGIVKPRAAYQVMMDKGFHPYRLDVSWAQSQDASIYPLLELLDFSQGKKNWGYLLRFGLFEVKEKDMTIIAKAMQAYEQLMK